MGADATDELNDILAGKNEQLMKWAEEKGILEAAVYSKAAQVLGDLADRRSTPILLKRLNYLRLRRHEKLLPRMFSAEALGRIRDERAVRPIAALLPEEEANARGTYTRALVMIGDRAAVPALAKAAVSGFMYDCREEAQWGLADFGGPGDLARYDAVVKTNTNIKTCEAWFQCDPGTNRAECMKDIDKACSTRIEKYTKRAAKYRPMLVAADKCNDDAACWVDKLKANKARVREKAAWELGRTGDIENLDALLAAAQEDNLKARFAILNAVDTLLFGANDKTPNPAVGKKVAERMRGILTAEEGKAQFIQINEDTKRLALKVERALRNGHIQN